MNSVADYVIALFYLSFGIATTGAILAREGKVNRDDYAEGVGVGCLLGALALVLALLFVVLLVQHVHIV